MFNFKNNYRVEILRYLPLAAAIIALLIMPELGLASVESTLTAIQDKLINTLLPLMAILGLVFAGFSFVAGSPNARVHLFLAITGAIVGFAAPSIVAMLRSLVN